MTMWMFLAIAVTVSAAMGVLREAILGRGRRRDTETGLTDLRSRLDMLESRSRETPLLAAPESARMEELEQRIRTLETIITQADELLEKQFHAAARGQTGGRRSDP